MNCPTCKNTRIVHFQGRPETCPVCEGMQEETVIIRESATREPEPIDDGHGWSKTHYSPGKSANFISEDGIYMKLKWSDGQKILCELSFLSGLLTISTGDFSYPHKHFEMFYRQIWQAKLKLEA